jgi:drug/metabolite transporter (DMT)-like permease
MRLTRTRWFLPAFSLALGGAMLAAFAVGGHTGLGLYSLGVMAAAGAVFLLGGHSETIRGLRGDGRDERFSRMDLLATAFAGLVLIVAVIVAFLVEVARGHNGMQYAWLGAVAGLAYLAAIVVLRVRG